MKSLSPCRFAGLNHSLQIGRLLALGLGSLAALCTVSSAALRPGAPRALRLEWHTGTTSFLQPRQTDGSEAAEPVFMGDANGSEPPTIFFTGESNGTRNIWQSVTEDGNFDANNFKVGQWQAHPVTTLSAPAWASQPVPARDGHSLLYTTNVNLAQAGAGQATAGQAGAFSQIVRLDLQSKHTTSLTDGQSRNHSPAVSPDGSRFAFISDRSGLEALYLMPIRGGLARRVATLAQHPYWLDDSTLLYRSTRAGQEGLYRLTINKDGSASRPALLLRNGLQATLSPDRRLLCAVIQTGSGTKATTQLCTLAPDGSGVQTLTGTEGARSPQFSPSGTAIVFDAPLGTDSKQHTLWLVPMLRSLPVAQLREVRPVSNRRMSGSLGGEIAAQAEIIGTAFAEAMGAVTLKIEVGEGNQPRRWTELHSQPGPIHNNLLALWQPPLNARGEWAVRLTVTDATGDSSQSTLNVTLPLDPPAPSPVTPFVFSRDAGRSQAEPSTVTVVRTPEPTPTPTVKPTPVPVPTKAPVKANRPTKPTNRKPSGNTRPTTRRSSSNQPVQNQPVQPGSTVPILPLPALPPAPGQTETTPAPSGQEAFSSLPEFPVMTAPEATNPADSPAPPPLPPQLQPQQPPANASSSAPPRTANTQTANTGRQHRATTTQSNSRTAPRTSPQPADSSGTTSGSGDRATIDIDGTPAEMAPGEKVDVQATLKNLGSTGWGSSGQRPVRLIYRWVDLKSGYRRRWAFQWLRTTVAPGDSTKMSVSLTAPPYPGHYRLIYALIRIDGDGYKPPAATSTSEQVKWPGEFGGTAFIVDVR